MGMQDFKTERARSTRINVLWVYTFRQNELAIWKNCSYLYRKKRYIITAKDIEIL